MYRDGVEITGDEFYRRLVTASRLPTTSQPTPGDFLSAYNEKGQITDEIISIHVSAKLSGTMNSATQAREEYAGSSRIEIVDSMQGSMGLGVVAIAAAEAASRGGSLDDVADGDQGRFAQRRVHRVWWTHWSTWKRAGV